MRLVARACRGFLTAYDRAPSPYDLDTNGEALVVERLVGPTSTVFDVGANIGDWTAMAVARGARVHSFEISPPTARHLADRFQAHPSVSVNDIGLADRDGAIELLHYPDEPRLSTTVPGYPHGGRIERREATVRRGDDYATEAGVDHIDLLKIDVEGAEPAVLRGFSHLLAAGGIDAIQFEYGLVAVIDKFLLSDFYALLTPLGYVIGPLTPGGVVFQDYDLHLELFEHVNWVAVRTARPDLVERVRSDPPPA